MTKIDRRILKTQEALKAAIIDLMKEKSFDDITIQDLSDRANVSRGTIYLHYMDKYDLLDKLIETHIDELRVRCAAAADLDFATGSVLWTEYFESHYAFSPRCWPVKGLRSSAAGSWSFWWMSSRMRWTTPKERMKD